jgi:DnaJ-like protein
MAEYADDVRYAYLKLGLDIGAPLDKIAAAHTNAYRFRTRERIKTVCALMEFFAARSILGGLEDSFVDIQKAYRQKARAFHPDLHPDDPSAEEKLKEINIAYGLIEAMQREAVAYFSQPESLRHSLENEARETYQREADVQSQNTASAKSATYPEEVRERQFANSAFKYMAASVPRNIRMMRLSYLSSNYIIGSRYIKNRDGSYVVFDVIMLPEKEFNRARIYLSAPNPGDPVLRQGGFIPTYIVKGARELTIPPGTYDPEAYAKAHFLEEFKLTQEN